MMSAVLIALLALCIRAVISYEWISTEQYNSLYSLYNATDGANWLWDTGMYAGIEWNFDGTSDPCGDFWQGVLCNMYACGDEPNDCLVMDLNLTSRGLRGTLPSELGALSNLRQFDVAFNTLSGPLPAEIANMQALQVFVVSFNSISGTIPPSLGNQSSLQVLFLDDNHIGGPIPLSLVGSGVLETLYLNDNMLTGALPEDMCTVAANLSFISFDYNRLTGTLPESLFSSCVRLEFLSVLGNAQLAGYLPSTLYAATGLYQLTLADNFFSGPVASSLEQLSNLVVLRLEYNTLSGSFPGVLSTCCVDLVSVLLQGNQFTGLAAALFSAESQTKLQNVDISDNMFSGTVPAEAFSLSALETFAATKNCLTGYIPTSVCNASRLKVLSLDGLGTASRCSVSINLPLFKGRFSTFIGGTIPGCIFALPEIVTLHLSGNGLKGKLAQSLPLNSKMKNLSLSHNRISGEIPFAIQQWPFLQLDLGFNKIRGNCRSLTNLPLQTSQIDSSQDAYNTTSLSLVQNRFSGDIPLNFETAYNIDILRGNLFACPRDGAALPEHDPYNENYSCGSADYSHALIILFGLIASVIVVGVLRMLHSYHYGASSSWFVFEMEMEKSRPDREVRVDSTSSAPEQGGSVARGVTESLCAAVAYARFWIGGKLYFGPHITDYVPVSSISNVHRFVGLLHTFRRLSLFICAVALFLCLPVYMTLYAVGNNTYSTHTEVYLYVTTAVFLEGALPGVLCTFLWTGCLVVLFVVIMHVHDLLCYHVETASSSNGYSFFASSSISLSGVGSELQHLKNRSVSQMRSIGMIPLQLWRKAGEARGSVTNTTEDLENVETVNPITAEAKEPETEEAEDNSTPAMGTGRYGADNTTTTADKVKPHPYVADGGLFESGVGPLGSAGTTLHIFSLSSLFFLLNAAVVLTINGVYIVIINDNLLTSTGKLILQLALATFKVFWNQVVVRIGISYVRNPTKMVQLGRRGHSELTWPASTDADGEVHTTLEAESNSRRNMRLYVTTLIFNFLIAPFMAAYVTDSSCIYELFDPPAPVTSSYTFNYCYVAYLVGKGDLVCAVSGNPSFMTSFVPPFIYSFAVSAPPQYHQMCSTSQAYFLD